MQKINRLNKQIWWLKMFCLCFAFWFRWFSNVCKWISYRKGSIPSGSSFLRHYIGLILNVSAKMINPIGTNTRISINNPKEMIIFFFKLSSWSCILSLFFLIIFNDFIRWINEIKDRIKLLIAKTSLSGDPYKIAVITDSAAAINE